LSGAGQKIVNLNAGAMSLGIDPGLGASIAYLRWGKVSVLRETPIVSIAQHDGRAFSAFPLVPFSNRIRGAQFSFGNEHYTVAHDAEDPRHALHGTARFYPWRVTAQSETKLRCTLDYTPQNLDWPFAYQAWQQFELFEDRLRVTVGLRNTHGFAAPFGIGLHPYFVREPGTALAFTAGYLWAKDRQDIPSFSIPDDGRYNFSYQHAIDAGLIDNDYGGWDGRLQIFAPNRPRLTLTASGVFDNLVVFTPVGKNYFAAEPVSHRPDAVNETGDAMDQGMTILARGTELEGVVEIIVG
jgi:aldose 1-epimerase